MGSAPTPGSRCQAWTDLSDTWAASPETWRTACRGATAFSAASAESRGHFPLSPRESEGLRPERPVRWPPGSDLGGVRGRPNLRVVLGLLTHAVLRKYHAAPRGPDQGHTICPLFRFSRRHPRSQEHRKIFTWPQQLLGSAAHLGGRVYRPITRHFPGHFSRRTLALPAAAPGEVGKQLRGWAHHFCSPPSRGAGGLEREPQATGEAPWESVILAPDLDYWQ